MIIKRFIKKNLKGNALIFTMFILSGMLVVAMSGAYLIMTGIIAAGVQSQSTRAYYAAESGVEQILWEFRQSGADYGTDERGTGVPIVEGSIRENVDYKIYHTFNPTDPMTLHNYTSIGSFNYIKRSVEVSF